MKGSRVYLLWEIDYDVLDVDWLLVDIFSAKKDAKAYKDKLVKKNKSLLIKDAYGPIHGKDYLITHKKVK